MPETVIMGSKQCRIIAFHYHIRRESSKINPLENLLEANTYDFGRIRVTYFPELQQRDHHTALLLSQLIHITVRRYSQKDQ